MVTGALSSFGGSVSLSLTSGWSGGLALRIASKVFLVGGIPIAIAAVIATAAWFLLREADITRSGAVLAGSIYRDLLRRHRRARPLHRSATGRPPRYRPPFQCPDRPGRTGTGGVVANARTPEQSEAVAGAQDNLRLYTAQLRRLTTSTEQNDRLLVEMSDRAAELIDLTDQARTRQHASNADIVASLSEKDRRLRLIRDIVDKAQELRAIVATTRAECCSVRAGAGRRAPKSSSHRRKRRRHEARARGQAFARTQVRNTVLDLVRVLGARAADARRTSCAASWPGSTRRPRAALHGCRPGADPVLRAAAQGRRDRAARPARGARRSSSPTRCRPTKPSKPPRTSPSRH